MYKFDVNTVSIYGTILVCRVFMRFNWAYQFLKDHTCFGKSFCIDSIVLIFVYVFS